MVVRKEKSSSDRNVRDWIKLAVFFATARTGCVG